MNLIFLDLETTGLDPDKHEILSIFANSALVTPYPEESRTELRINDECVSRKVQPQRIENASPRALEINGYTPEAWADAVPLYEMLADLHRYVAATTPEGEKALMAGHNVGNFDRPFLVNAYRSCGQIPWPAFDYHTLDTSWVTFSQYVVGKASSLSLDVARDLFSTSAEDAHTAENDVRMSALLFIAALGFERTDDLRLWETKW